MKSGLWNFDILRAERKRRGWSQAKVAEALGVDISTVRRWEAGQAAPFPYHRRKICALFDKTPGELGLFSDADEEREVPSTGALSRTSLPTDLAPSEPLESAESLMEPDESLKLTRQSLSSRPLWHVCPDPINHLLAYRSSRRFSWRPFFIISAILLAVLLIFGGLSTFIGLSLLMRIHQAHYTSKGGRGNVSYNPSAYALRFSNTDPSVQSIQNVFNAVCAQLVNRFALDPVSDAKNTVTITFSPDLPTAATTSGRTITINPHWIEQHPNDMGLLTHQLTLVAEHYPSGAPAWFADGMADYARSVYGPADDDWSLPDGVQPQESYQQGSKVAARFLLWLELHTRPDIVDQLNHALQRGQPFSAAFRSLTHATVDGLWSQYQTHPDITPTPQQRYNIATSRKLLYHESSYDELKGSSSYYAYAGDLYLSNFAMQVDITLVSGDAGAGLFVRSDDTNWDEIFLFANGDYRLDNVYQSQFQFGPLIFNPAIKVGLNQTNRLTVIVEKHSIYLYINGQFITRVDDTHLLSSGTLGVIMSKNYTSGPLNPDARFDNLQVF